MVLLLLLGGLDDPGAPRTKVPFQQLPEAAQLAFDEGEYRLFAGYVSGNDRLPLDGGPDFLEPGTAALAVTIATDKGTGRAGDPLMLSVAVTDPAGARTVDASLAVQFADGRTTLSFTGAGFTPAMTPIAHPFPFASGAALGPLPGCSFTLPGSIPAGTYPWTLTLADPGDPAALLACAGVTMTIQP